MVVAFQFATLRSVMRLALTVKKLELGPRLLKAEGPLVAALRLPFERFELAEPVAAGPKSIAKG